MARDKVIVNGVVLTRADVATAVALLAQPDPVANLSLVQQQKNSSIKGVVITGAVQEGYATSRLFQSHYMYTVVMSNGDGPSYGTEESLLADWKVTGSVSDDVGVQLDGGGGKIV